MKEFERKLINRKIKYLRSAERGSFYIIKDYNTILETIPYYTIRKLSPPQLDQLVDKLLILFLFS